MSVCCRSPDSLDSCQGRCGYGTDSSYTCQCNQHCGRYNDCCYDYEDICKGELCSFDSTLCSLSAVKCLCVFLPAGSTSCKGRCGEDYSSQNKCHCNSKCTQYSNCCSDYADLCDGEAQKAADPLLMYHMSLSLSWPSVCCSDIWLARSQVVKYW